MVKWLANKDQLVNFKTDLQNTRVISSFYRFKKSEGMQIFQTANICLEYAGYFLSTYNKKYVSCFRIVFYRYTYIQSPSYQLIGPARFFKHNKFLLRKTDDARVRDHFQFALF